MKKLILLSLVSIVGTFLWASEVQPKRIHKPAPSTKGVSNYSRNHKPKSLRSGSLQTVPIGKAGNVLSVLNANCHQIDVDSILNTVLFIHRSDTVYHTNYNVAQYRYDISTNGGSTWGTNIGPLNPAADNVTINGRYPEAVLRPDVNNPTNPDSAWIVYNGSWHNGGSPISVWQGQYFGVGRLDGDTTTYTEHNQIVNNANVEISTSMIQSIPGHYWNLNLDFTQLTAGTPETDTTRGLIIEKGVWSDSAGEVIWSYTDVPIGTVVITTTSEIYNNLYSPTISFDPTGRYGWITMAGNTGTYNQFATYIIYMTTSDSGQTWSTPQTLYIPGIPGIFSIPNSLAGTTVGQSVLGDIQVMVDSAGNPHILTIVNITDTTNGDIYPYAGQALYDIYYNPSIAGCNWQAYLLSNVYSYYGEYTTDNTGDGNRIQAARTKDGTKIFVFWTDTDSGVVAAAATNPPPDYTNTSPNLFGIGIDMSTLQTTDVFDFTAGDPLFGGQISSPATAAGSLGGALFPVVSPTVLHQVNGTYNIPVVLTDPDYLNATNKLSTNPASFYYCQNINFTQSQFVNKFDNVPPTLTVNGPDTAFVLLGDPYTPPTATAYDCVFGNINPQYSSTVPTNGSGNTDSSGVYLSTWVATNALGNSTTVTQVVIVSGPPIARIYYTTVYSDYKFAFTDTSLNFPTSRIWYWGDGTSNSLPNNKHANKVYTSGGVKCVILKVTNQYGSSSDTVCIDVHLAGINDIDLSNKISLYPNPSSGMMTLELTDDIAKGATVTVLNVLGQEVHTPIEIRSSVNQSMLDLSNLESGAYLLKIATPAGTAIKQFVINK